MLFSCVSVRQSSEESVIIIVVVVVAAAAPAVSSSSVACRGKDKVFTRPPALQPLLAYSFKLFCVSWVRVLPVCLPQKVAATRQRLAICSNCCCATHTQKKFLSTFIPPNSSSSSLLSNPQNATSSFPRSFLRSSPAKTNTIVSSQSVE